jgi:hypothetical protein
MGDGTVRGTIIFRVDPSIQKSLEVVMLHTTDAAAGAPSSSIIRLVNKTATFTMLLLHTARVRSIGKSQLA